ncbi:MAG: endonuclease/exonuclease/phosphatase family protein [Alphaproteobacteria bacterium]|nr:endonuclease/exonuclease/phosphatase family protein [Alphaproteobacteria bacterium]MCB9696074.1 endonuclease/exonuclease/phosphatase family protein [Alphaproteobacteria bacterium]
MRFLPALLTFVACSRTPPPLDGGTDGDADTDVDADSDADTDHDTIRVVTWNVETLGAAGTDEYVATRDVLARIDADVIGLNELTDGESSHLQDLADDLGMAFSLVPSSNPFGPLRNAVLTRLPVVTSHTWTSAELSGDNRANDVTRLPVSVIVEIDGGTLALVSEHWQSGFYDSDTFRRCVDGERVGQAADEVDADIIVVAGDVNAELEDGLGNPAAWTSLPSGIPGSFWLGSDLYARVTGGGLPNDPFLSMTDRGLTPVDALQIDGRDTTRDSSGRRLDYLFVSSRARVAGSEVYDSRDDGSGGLPKAGSAPARDATARASDHFPVFIDVGL